MKRLRLTSPNQLVRHVDMLDGVVVSESKAQKDELILEGNDVQNVSQSGMRYPFYSKMLH